MIYEAGSALILKFITKYSDPRLSVFADEATIDCDGCLDYSAILNIV